MSLTARGTPLRTPVQFGTPQGWPLLGRDAELGYLAEAIAGGRAGIVLAGNAGVGKTRLAREAIRRAEEAGSATAWVVATRAGASIPFGPLTHLLPEILPSTTSRPELLLRIAEGLSGRARGGRLVIGIDDAHLLDDASAALTHQLALSPEFFILATMRAGEAVPDSVTALWKDGLAERFEVQALSEDRVRELIRQVLGGQVDGQTLARLWGTTGGNVLFLRELLLAGQESGALGYAGGVWSWTGPVVVSPRLQEVLDARLGTLQPDQVALMEVLAYTEPASVSFLETLFSSSTLQSAERQGVVLVEKDGRRLAVRLAHPLYGESVRARCGVLRARDVQRQLAAALEATGARRRDDQLRMATARLEGGGSGSPQLLVAGARRAYAAFDLGLAEHLTRAALDAGGGMPARSLLNVMLQFQGRFSEMESFDAGGKAAPTHDSERAVKVVRKASALWISAGRTDDAEEVLIRAQRDVEDPDLRDELEWLRGGILLLSGRPAEAITALSRILERPGAREWVCIGVAHLMAVALAVSGRSEQAIAIAERWIGAAERLAEEAPLADARLLSAKASALCFAGRLDEAGALATEEYRRALSRQAHENAISSPLCLGSVALMRGQGKTAARWLREAVALHQPSSMISLLPLCLAGLARAATLTRDLTTARAALAEAEDALTPGMALMESDVRLARAWVAAAHGEVSAARVVALEAADRAEESGAYAYTLLALHDVVRFGDARAVARRLRRLAYTVDGPFAPACAAHAEALVAHDGPGLDRASASFEAMGANLLAAEAAAEAAAVYRAEGRKASMRARSARARRLIESCEGARTPAFSGLAPDPLTPREREVATLAAGGLTSAEIAERLVLSTRTVENHLQRGYAKLGIANRSELGLVL
jgi:DNA-binding NarL/FixJ family response regulator